MHFTVSAFGPDTLFQYLVPVSEDKAGNRRRQLATRQGPADQCSGHLIGQTLTRSPLLGFQQPFPESRHLVIPLSGIGKPLRAVLLHRFTAAGLKTAGYGNRQAIELIEQYPG